MKRAGLWHLFRVFTVFELARLSLIAVGIIIEQPNNSHYRHPRKEDQLPGAKPKINPTRHLRSAKSDIRRMDTHTPLMGDRRTMGSMRGQSHAEGAGTREAFRQTCVTSGRPGDLPLLYFEGLKKQSGESTTSFQK
ncbi:hypothetical protein JTE90_019263 [Oedothorax gibbosus]|uniref:Uncharacterized protein n=1 Tax=Oedothorax gibbosus TaxID=931172 RepID=A0AAV6UT90_9ARAC|nr:hypothetical protein JTE90_019263 [Oedothorax gibbosus]